MFFQEHYYFQFLPNFQSHFWREKVFFKSTFEDFWTTPKSMQQQHQKGGNNCTKVPQSGKNISGAVPNALLAKSTLGMLSYLF